jgi:hypothetical protein
VRNSGLFFIGFQVAFFKEAYNYISNFYKVDWQLLLSELIFTVLSENSNSSMQTPNSTFPIQELMDLSESALI